MRSRTGSPRPGPSSGCPRRPGPQPGDGRARQAAARSGRPVGGDGRQPLTGGHDTQLCACPQDVGGEHADYRVGSQRGPRAHRGESRSLQGRRIRANHALARRATSFPSRPAGRALSPGCAPGGPGCGPAPARGCSLRPSAGVEDRAQPAPGGRGLKEGLWWGRGVAGCLRCGDGRGREQGLDGVAAGAGRAVGAAVGRPPPCCWGFSGHRLHAGAGGRAEGAVCTGVAVTVVLLWALAAGCVVAEKAVRRQAARQARAARHASGLPKDADMGWIVWVVAGCLLAACGLAVWVTQTRLDPASARPEELLDQAQQVSATAAIVMSTALVGVGGMRCCARAGPATAARGRPLPGAGCRAAGDGGFRWRVTGGVWASAAAGGPVERPVLERRHRPARGRRRSRLLRRRTSLRTERTMCPVRPVTGCRASVPGVGGGIRPTRRRHRRPPGPRPRR